MSQKDLPAKKIEKPVANVEDSESEIEPDEMLAMEEQSEDDQLEIAEKSKEEETEREEEELDEVEM